ncbi:MAG: hypothetical protein ABSD20_04905 [Terriglobales bacterium]|jgi:hypothetical protein
MMQPVNGGSQVAVRNTRPVSRLGVVKWCWWLAACCLPLLALKGHAQLVPQEAYTAKKAAQQAVRATNGRVAESDAAAAQAASGEQAQNAGNAQVSGSLVPGKSGDTHGKRDPFASIVRSQSDGGPGCSTGKKCLEVEQIVLKGVVKSPDGMVAMVENQHRRSYFLRESDPIFNAQVIRITKDSIVFRENVLDKVGHVKVREVVKRLGVAGPAA